RRDRCAALITDAAGEDTGLYACARGYAQDDKRARRCDSPDEASHLSILLRQGQWSVTVEGMNLELENDRLKLLQVDGAGGLAPLTGELHDDPKARRLLCCPTRLDEIDADPIAPRPRVRH